MRTTIPILSPPDAYNSRQAVSLPQIPSSPQQSAVVVTSLAQLRPGPRCANEYVDSPRPRPSAPLKKHLHSPSFATGGGIEGGGLSSLGSPPLRQSRGTVTDGNSGGLNIRHHHRPHLSSPRPTHAGSVSTPITTTLPSGSTVLVVSHQPLSKLPPLKKDADDTVILPFDGQGRDTDRGRLHSNNEGTGSTSSCTSRNPTGPDSGVSNKVSGADLGNDHASIICKKCGKCRCRDCTEHQDLPCGTWCCGGKCELTPSKALDICTCFCVVKCLFFHCRRGEEEEDDNECYENPCGCCETPLCCQRWTVLGLMSACLPCLWTYWPARACLAASTATYNTCCRHRGCKCKPSENANPATSVGLAPVSSSSSAMKSSVLSSVRAGGNGNSGTKDSEHSQARRLLIESDSSSA